MARNIPQSPLDQSPFSAQKPHIGLSGNFCPNMHLENSVYLFEVQQGYILFLVEKSCQSLYPLGYVDGMSLYNGYFASHFMLDPYGKCVSCASSSIINLITAMNAFKVGKLCDKCAWKCKEPCTVKKCKEDGKKLAATLTVTFMKYANHPKSYGIQEKKTQNSKDIKAGWMCYHWRTLLYEEIMKNEYECFKIKRVGYWSVRPDKNGRPQKAIIHNWISITVGKKSPQVSGDCSLYFDIWKNVTPGIYTEKEFKTGVTKNMRPNFIADDKIEKDRISGKCTSYTQKDFPFTAEENWHDYE